MQINYPTQKNGLPADHEVRDVVRSLCRLCDFNENLVRLTYIGGDRRRIFSKCGIKLMRACQFTVQMYIGCPSQTVETHFQLLGVDGRATAGCVVYQKLYSVFQSRVLLITENAAKKESRDSVRNTDDGVAKVDFNTPTVDAERALLVENEITQTNQSGLPSSVANDDLPSRQNEVKYKHFFDNPAKLHLGVCALVAMCDEDTRRPFSLFDFKKVCEDINVPSSAGLPMSIIKIFLYREFLVRINPGSPSARYSITQLAVDFARGPAPDKPVRITKHAPKKTGPPVQLSTGLRQTLLELKSKIAEQEEMKKKVAAVELELNRLKEVDIQSEKNKAESEISSHEKRIADLRQYLKDLDKRREDIKKLETELASLKTGLQNPEIIKALKEFEEIKSLLN